MGLGANSHGPVSHSTRNWSRGNEAIVCHRYLCHRYTQWSGSNNQGILVPFHQHIPRNLFSFCHKGDLYGLWAPPSLLILGKHKSVGSQCHVSPFTCQYSDFTVAQVIAAVRMCGTDLTWVGLSVTPGDQDRPAITAPLGVFHIWTNLHCCHQQSTVREASFMSAFSISLLAFSPAALCQVSIAVLTLVWNSFMLCNMLLILPICVPSHDKATIECALRLFGFKMFLF